MELTENAIALYIKVEDGKPIDHPVLPSNLIQVMGGVPDNYEPFIRFSQSQRLPLGDFEVPDEASPTYAKVNGVWTDVFARRPMNAEERAAKEVELLAAKQILVNDYKSYAQSILDVATDSEIISIFANYIASIDAIDLTTTSAEELPKPPTSALFTLDKKLVSITNSGSAPDVIG